MIFVNITLQRIARLQGNIIFTKERFRHCRVGGLMRISTEKKTIDCFHCLSRNKKIN